MLDQLAHFAVIIACASLIYQDTISVADLISQYWTIDHLSVLLAYLLVTIPVGYFVGIATQKWREEVTQNGGDEDSLAKAGKWIGIMERVLVLTFVLLQQFGAIGFLIAAKSILRFSDKDDHNPRKQTEYVLIGTLLSFTIALFIGLLALR